MADEKVRELLVALRTPEVQEKLNSLTRPADKEGVIRCFTEAAKLLGMDVSEADIREAIAEEEWKQMERTEKASEGIQALTDEDTELVAGGVCIEFNNPPSDVEEDPECGYLYALFHG